MVPRSFCLWWCPVTEPVDASADDSVVVVVEARHWRAALSRRSGCVCGWPDYPGAEIVRAVRPHIVSRMPTNCSRVVIGFTIANLVLGIPRCELGVTNAR